MKSVAPRVGAWIETTHSGFAWRSQMLSHPVWVRGLKQHPDHQYGRCLGVAPRVGAWIET